MLLESYEIASSQMLNKDKTSIYFSKDTREDTKQIITSITRVRATTSYEKYLRLPASVGKSKASSFKGIVDKMQDRVKNWNTKYLHK